MALMLAMPQSAKKYPAQRRAVRKSIVPVPMTTHPPRALKGGEVLLAPPIIMVIPANRARKDKPK
jgi:hypothetical protein